MADRGSRREEDYDFDEEAIPDQKLMFKAFRGEYQKLKRQVDEMDMPRILRKLDELDLKIDAISEGSKRVSTKNHHSNGSNQEHHDKDSEEENSVNSRRHRDREHVDSNLNAIKMQIPPFRGRIDAEAYLEWERKVELIFACHNYSEEKKVRLAAVEFSDYALIWWDETMKSRRRNGERPIRTWEAMKQVMRKWFVPSYYYRELHQRLHRLYQGSKSVEEYHKEMEMLMIESNIEEDPEVTMARFLSGLNREIVDVVELHQYMEMENLVNMAMKVERKHRIRVAKAFFNSNSKWSSKGAELEDKKESKVSDLKEKSMDSYKKNSSILASSNSSSRHRDITCFKGQGLGHHASECPNKGVMVLRANKVFSESENEGSDGCEDMPPLKDCSDHEDEVEYAVHGEALVVK